ncbi:four helix bundle protein [Cerasicoccus fimbriatus]|uniref:four helix bundle protein n=1 Tax=Cerasicoccus fimbriatus TaxID=3014554 RepID=UPI0022B36270|nr:four helix bundle protein [Cerasicoccus sp. TK19100]
MSNFFPHESQKVYQLGIEWVVMVENIIEGDTRRKGLADQLDNIANTIPIHIVAGLGKNSAGERVKAFDAAKSQVLACSAVMDMMVARNVMENGDANRGKRHLSEMARLLNGMIQSANTHELIRNRLQVPS